MDYTKSYLKALLDFLIFFGVANLVYSAIFTSDLQAKYFCFLAINGALAGPLRVYINSREKTKESI